MSDLDLVTKSAIANMAQSLPRIAYALEALAVAADASRPESAFIREAEKLTSLCAQRMKLDHQTWVREESYSTLVMNDRRYRVRVEIQDCGAY